MIKIEALHLLLLIELSVVLCGIAGYFFARARRFRKLYAESQRKFEDAQRTLAQREIAAPVQTASVVEQGQNAAAGALDEKTANLQHIVDFQKNMLLDLLSSKDAFENAQQKLASIHTSYQELQLKINERVEATSGKDTIEGQTGILESGNRDLEANICLLKAENESLSAKFTAWEERLQKLWESPAAAGQMGLAQSTDQGSSEQGRRIQELEGIVQENNRQMKDLQTKLDNLEKEYLILYQQKQDQEKEKEQQNG